MTGDGLVVEFNAHEFLRGSFGLLLGECFLADKLLLIEFHEHAKSCHDGGDSL